MKRKSCILCFKGDKYSNIVCNFLQEYSIENKFDYIELDFKIIKEKTYNDISLFIENYIYDNIEKYKNVLIYYTGKAIDKDINNIPGYTFLNFSYIEINGEEIDVSGIISNIIYDWEKKIIAIFDCDSLLNNNYINIFKDKYKDDFKKCTKLNIFKTINYSIIISSIPSENITGLFTLNLFNEKIFKSEKKLELILDIIKKNNNILYDVYNIVPEDDINKALKNGFYLSNEENSRGYIMKI